MSNGANKTHVFNTRDDAYISLVTVKLNAGDSALGWKSPYPRIVELAGGGFAVETAAGTFVSDD
jgi:hypothetical protein